MSVFLFVKARLRWGKECQDYRIAAMATTGQLARKPAMQLKVQWGNLPSWIKKTSTTYVICSFLNCCVAFFTLVGFINALIENSSMVQKYFVNVF